MSVGTLGCGSTGRGKAMGAYSCTMMKRVMGSGLSDVHAPCRMHRQRLNIGNKKTKWGSFHWGASTTRLVVKASHQFPMAPALGEFYNKVKTHLAQTYVTVLPGESVPPLCLSLNVLSFWPASSTQSVWIFPPFRLLLKAGAFFKANTLHCTLGMCRPGQHR